MMSDILKEKIVRIRKPHICFGCGRKFSPPYKMTFSAVTECGTVYTFYLCETCTIISNNMNFGDEFCYGDLRDEALEREEAERALEEGQNK